MGSVTAIRAIWLIGALAFVLVPVRDQMTAFSPVRSESEASTALFKGDFRRGAGLRPRWRVCCLAVVRWSALGK